MKKKILLLCVIFETGEKCKGKFWMECDERLWSFPGFVCFEEIHNRMKKTIHDGFFGYVLKFTFHLSFILRWTLFRNDKQWCWLKTCGIVVFFSFKTFWTFLLWLEHKTYRLEIAISIWHYKFIETRDIIEIK